MPSKRKATQPKPDAPITGVAAGSLGTAANLDDTKVMRTADLQAAAPGWLEDEAPDVADELPPAAPEPVMPPPQPKPKAVRPRRARPVAAATLPVFLRNWRAPRAAAVAAFVVLLLIAGSGFLSQLNLGVGAGSEPAATGNAFLEAWPSPSPAPKEAKPGKCHGRSHNCQGNQD